MITLQARWRCNVCHRYATTSQLPPWHDFIAASGKRRHCRGVFVQIPATPVEVLV